MMRLSLWAFLVGTLNATSEGKLASPSVLRLTLADSFGDPRLGISGERVPKQLTVRKSRRLAGAPLQVALWDPQDAHAEVALSWVAALSGLDNVAKHVEYRWYHKTHYDAIPYLQTMNLTNPPAGMHHPEDLYHYNSPCADLPTHIKDAFFQPDVLIINTCYQNYHPADVNATEQLIRTLHDHDLHPQILCVVHAPKIWQALRQKTELDDVIKAGQVRLIVLADHVKRTMEEVLAPKVRPFLAANPALRSPPVQVFAPVYESSDSTSSSSGEDLYTVAIAIQGGIQSKRRNYNKVISELPALRRTTEQAEHLRSPDGQRLALRLRCIGQRHDALKIPEGVKDMVEVRHGLQTREYYRLLAKSSFILPAFANKKYLTDKASSSVPLSIIVGVPLVADRALLDAYSFLSADSVYLRQDGESEIAAVQRALLDPNFVQSHKEKVFRVESLRRAIIQYNKRLLRSWLEQDELLPTISGAPLHRLRSEGAVPGRFGTPISGGLEGSEAERGEESHENKELGVGDGGWLEAIKFAVFGSTGLRGLANPGHSYAEIREIDNA